MQKLVFFWAAGIGFTGMQIFLYLHSLWARMGLVLFMILAVWVFAKMPREFQIVYWIVLTLIVTVWYYGVKPADANPLL